MTLQTIQKNSRDRMAAIAEIDIRPASRMCAKDGCDRSTGRVLCGIHAARVRNCVRCGKTFRDTHKQCTQCRERQNRQCSCGKLFTGHKSKCRSCESRETLELIHAMQTDGHVSIRVRAEIRASGPCVFCGGIAEHACRVWPISKGGPESSENLVPACQDCSLSKNNSLLTEWLPDRVAYGIAHSAIVAAEFDRLMGVSLSKVAKVAI